MKPSALSALARRTEEPPISWLMHVALAHPKIISLAAGFTDNPSLPVREVHELTREILSSDKAGRAALQYGTTLGDPKLREATAQHLWRLDSLVGTRSTASTESKAKRIGDAVERVPTAYSTNRVIITSGSQQLLYMTTEALCDAGDIVLVEDPTYFVYLGIMQSHGLRARGVRLAADGLDLAHLERVLESLKRSGELGRVKLLYLITYFQNPTGITTTFAKKVGALKLLKKYERAAGHPIYLVEDAAYRELCFSSEMNGRDALPRVQADTPSPRPSGERAGARGFELETKGLLSPTLSSLGGGEGEECLVRTSGDIGCNEKSALAARGFENRVIYTGTYSKPFATGVRVGFGLLPEPVFAAVERIKGNHDFGTANLLQQILARAIESGRYDRHGAVLRKRYAHKASVMREALEKHFPPEVKWDLPRGGLYFWARLPRGMKSGPKSKLFRTALASDVLYVPGALCYADDPTRAKPDNEMRISFGSASEENIREGIKRLGKVLRKMLR